MIDIDKLEYDDAVVPIPSNAVYMELEVKILDEGELVTLKTALDANDIRKAFNLFDDTVSGDYPCYTLTEKGKELLREMESKA